MEKRIVTYTNKINHFAMTQMLVNYTKVRSFLGVRFVSLQDSLGAERKKVFFGKNRLRFNRKAKGLIVFAIITVMLVSFFAFLPKDSQSTPNTPQSSDNPTASPSGTPQETNNQTSTPNPLSQVAQHISNVADSAAQILSPSPTPHSPGVIASAQTINSTVWRAVAANAWQYFQPGVGVDSTTGLPNGGFGSPYFTDWDLGGYIQAVIDAQNLNLTTTDGAWGSYARLDKVLTWLETRELNNASYPYWFYQATDGKDYHADSDKATVPVDVVDTGRLFVALNNLRVFNSSLASRINNIVLYGQSYNRSDYAALVPSVQSDSLTSTSIYAYYIYSGFASFWPNDLSSAPSTILNNIFSTGNVTSPYGNVSLPEAAIICDPLLYSVFELNNNDSRLMALANQVYLAHEAYYNATGQYRAFSEGPSLSGQWAYEWVVLPDNQTWVVLDKYGSDFNITPLIYTKVAMGFLAIYNTTFARNMCVYLENALPDPADGYCEGVDESGTLLTGVGSNANGLILEAALYAIQNNP